VSTARGGSSWCRQPVVWLGIAIFGASLAGCAWMIMLASRHADRELPITGQAILHVPVAKAALTDHPPPASAPDDGTRPRGSE